MTDPCTAHNAAMLPLMRLIVDAGPTEEDQWVILESLCLGVGMLHKRTPRQTATFVEIIAERLTTGDRT